MSATGRKEPLATVGPAPEAEVCTRHDCEATDGLRAIDPHDPDHERRVLCPEHAFSYLEAIRR